MILELRKIGSVLDSRPAGREALLAIRPQLQGAKEIEIDFTDVNVLTPSFADEFITPLVEEYGEHISFRHTGSNITVGKTLAFLAEDWPAAARMRFN